MNLKKFAIRGIIVLAVFVALCMFFSGTIRTMTTPKVKLTSAKRGKMEERVELTCRPAFPEVDEITVELPEDISITILKVNTREGYKISKGDAVVQAKVTNYDQLRRTAQETYDSATEKLISLENKSRGIRISKRDQAYADAYFALKDARLAEVNARLDMDAQLSFEDLSMPDEGYPEGASEGLTHMIDVWHEAAAARDAAETAMEAAARYNVDENVLAYTSDKWEYEQQNPDAGEELRQLLAINNQVAVISAPHDGYVAVFEVKEGDIYDGNTALYALTAEEKLPVLRADVSSLERVVNEGQTVTMNPNSYDPIDTKVVATGVDAEGKKYCDIELTDAIIRARGSVYAMLQEDTVLSLIYRSKEATTLLPTNAVYGSGSDTYVFTVEKNTSAFGNGTLKVHKLSVKVLAEYGGTSSLEDDITYYTLAYGEDRAIEDGDTVMEYIN